MVTVDEQLTGEKREGYLFAMSQMILALEDMLRVGINDLTANDALEAMRQSLVSIQARAQHATTHDA